MVMVNTWAGDSRQWKILWLWLHAGSESDLRECGFVTITKIRIMRIGVLCVATLMYARVETFYCQCDTEIPGKNSPHSNRFCGVWSVGLFAALRRGVRGVYLGD